MFTQTLFSLIYLPSCPFSSHPLPLLILSLPSSSSPSPPHPLPHLLILSLTSSSSPSPPHLLPSLLTLSLPTSPSPPLLIFSLPSSFSPPPHPLLPLLILSLPSSSPSPPRPLLLLILSLLPSSPSPPHPPYLAVSAHRNDSVVWDAMLGLCLCSVHCAACNKVVGVTVLAANRAECVAAYVNKVRTQQNQHRGVLSLLFLASLLCLSVCV